MSLKNRKTIATILIIVISIILFTSFMYIKALNEKAFPEFIAILFAFLPALAINAIWNKKTLKKKE